MIFSLSPTNPIQFVPIKEFNPAIYQTKHFDEALQKCQTRFYQGKKTYFQKFTLLDRPVIQVLSDYSEIIVEIYQYIEEEVGPSTIVGTPTVNLVSSAITDQSFSGYDFAIDWNLYPEGYYQILLKYNSTPEEVTPTYVEYISEPIHTKEEHVGTIRFDYTNSENNFSIIFRGAIDPEEVDQYTWTGILRVEGDIKDFKPSSIDTIYNDEIHNTSLVRSRPFRQFMLSIGGGSEDLIFEGLPDYMVDKVNRVLSCNQVQIDGKYFCKSEGAQWQENRADNYQFSLQEISITESQNNFQLQLRSENPNELMVPIQKIIPYPNNTTNRVIGGIFKKNTLLEKICIVNTGGVPFTLSVRTTSVGASDDIDPPITKLVSGLTETVLINRLFGSDKEINLEGLDTSTANVYVIYKKLDAPNVGTSNPYASIGVGALCYYHEQNPDDFINDFDIITGLGQDETAWAGWAVCDGNHGTPDLRDKFILGNDGITNQGTKPAGQTGGSWLKRILITHLPVLSFRLFGSAETTAQLSTANDVVSRILSSAASGWGQYIMGKNNQTTPTLGTTNKLGSSTGDGEGLIEDNFDITPPYFRLIVVKKILDI